MSDSPENDDRHIVVLGRFRRVSPDFRHNQIQNLLYELFITSITVSELTHGVNRSKRRDENLARLEVLFPAFTVLPFDEMAARRCGHLKAELEEQGEPLDDLDLQIASVALVYDLPLATNNTKHLKRVKDLRIENWIEGSN